MLCLSVLQIIIDLAKAKLKQVESKNFIFFINVSCWDLTLEIFLPCFSLDSLCNEYVLENDNFKYQCQEVCISH